PPPGGQPAQGRPARVGSGRISPADVGRHRRTLVGRPSRSPRGCADRLARRTRPGLADGKEASRMTHRDLCVHSSTPDLRASGIVVRLGVDVVLDDVDVLARGGRVTALLGPNGSGKTTLLHVLAGLRKPDRGTVL